MTDAAVIAVAVALCAVFLCGLLFGAYVTDTRAEVDMLYRRVQQTEATMWRWRGELDALREIGVEVRVIDTSAAAHVWSVVEGRREP